MISSEQIIRENREQSVLVVNVSGAKDSIRTLGFPRGQLPAIPICCVMPDTGLEHVGPFQRRTGHDKWPHGSASHWVLSGTQTGPIGRWFGVAASFPPCIFLQCNSDLKRDLILGFTRQLPHRVVIHCAGKE